MLTEFGTVRSIEGTRAMVQVQRGSACEGCGARGGCQMLGGGGRDMLVEARNDSRAEVGDRVEISLPEASLLKASTLVYMVPLAVLIAAAAVGKEIGSRFGINADLAALLMGGGAFAVTLLLVRSRGKIMGEKPQYIPVITRVIASAAHDEHSESEAPPHPQPS